jgi:hypothetical protein
MEEISYEQLGVNFVTHVVTPERVAATIAGVAGDEVRVGPMHAGPGNAASVTAVGRIGEVTARVAWNAAPLVFDATIPIDLSLEVRIAGATHRYNGTLAVPLRITARAGAPVTLAFEIAPISPADVRVKLSASGVRARLLQRIGGVDDEVRRAVASAVNERLDSEQAKAVRQIDVMRYVEESWTPGR